MSRAAIVLVQIFLSILAISILWGAVFMMLLPANVDHQWVEVEYKIQEGEALWNICKNYCPNDMDLREYIDLVEEHNNIKGYIYAGQTITLFEEVE